jgi:acyl transferase domain-containing protein/thioesterase domain-containing protein/aryl carrier-like protein
MNTDGLTDFYSQSQDLIQDDAIEGIAVVGMSGRFPGAKNIDKFWHNLKNGVESISFFSDEELLASGITAEELNDPNYVKANGVVENIDLFDAAFFGFSPKEAAITDPQHRLFLECAWEALESAGYNPENYPGLISVYAGASGLSTYFLNNLYKNPSLKRTVSDYQMYIANDKDFLPTRVSYKLNLKGASINVQTACSTSLVAISMACQSLLNYQSDLALAGGVSIGLPQKTGYLYEEGMILSPDGHCRAFDAQSQGTVGGNGLGVVLLKRLEDAIADGDYIYAVIKGSAINNDGAMKVGYTAPSVDGQAEAIAQALAIAEVDPETITYIEAHGTATPLGDPIEIAALTQAFRQHTNKKSFCAIGSVKTNIGHLNTAAGVAGFIKTVLALKHKLIPPSLHFKKPNPKIDFANSPFYINNKLTEWKPPLPVNGNPDGGSGSPLRAAVSSFGIGGTNAHVILEESPIIENSSESRPAQLILLSAKTATALDTATKNLVAHFQQYPDINLADAAYTLQVGRKDFNHRRIVVCSDLEDAKTALKTLDQIFSNFQESKQRPVVFMFSGQGSQYVNMGLELYQFEPIFREQIDHCAEILKPYLKLDLRDILYPSEEQLEAATEKIKQTAIAQPAIFVIEYALAKLWIAWGISPQAMIGHSIGEYVAACLSGVFSLDEALSLVAARGQLMQQMPPGSMLAVPLSEQDLQPYLNAEVAIAVINSPTNCVVSGDKNAIAQLESQLNQQSVECRHLHTSHAFHSAMMEPILEPFTQRVRQINLQPPQIPYISNLTGNWITAAEATNPNYWAKHLRQTVRFAAGVKQFFTEPDWILLEIGAGQTLSTLTRRHPDKPEQQIVLSSVRHPQEKQSDLAFLLTTIGKLWLSGIEIDWSKYYKDEKRHRIPLPTYPFERQRYWIEPPQPLNNIHPQTLVVDQQLPNKLDLSLGNAVNYEPNSTSTQNEAESLYQRPVQNTYIAPKNDLEQKLVNIWQDFLGIQQVGIYDDYFELGGDSLLAVQLISQLRTNLKIELSTKNLIETPTIAGLATLIEKTQTNSNLVHQAPELTKLSHLVTIRGTGNKQPLFCVHPIGGNVFCYKKLAHYLGTEQPFYALQAKGLDGNQPFTQIQQMAAEYIKALQTIQPQGTYLLGGWSFGGIVAFEMAQQLQQQGQEVALLALIDSSAPKYNYQLAQFDDADLLTWFATDLGIDIGKDIATWSQHLRQLKPEEQLQYILNQAQQASILPATATIEYIRPLIQVFKSNLQALGSYVPQVYSQQIDLFTASEAFPLFATEKFTTEDSVKQQDDTLGWAELSSIPIEVHKIPGNHYTIMGEPHVNVLAAQLKSHINPVNLNKN